jgi:uncharacterized membrane protein
MLALNRVGSVRPAMALSLLALAAGVALIGTAAVEGGATVVLVLVVPVILGQSPMFLGGVGLVIVGLIGSVLAAGPFSVDGKPLPTDVERSPRGSGSGGIVLVGPIPIAWGSATGLSRRARWGLAVVGGILLAIAVVAFVWVR